MRRIHITGASGTGTTTLGRALADRLGCPHFDSDDYYWLPTQPPYGAKRDKAERDAMLLRALQGAPAWVESGSLVSWSPEIAEMFHLAVFLWVPEDIRLDRLRRREIAELGRVDPEFMAWAASYDHAGAEQRSRTLHEEWLAGLSCPVVRIEGDLTTAVRLARVLEHLEWPP